jgi:lysophospholipase L1-like esterase
MLRFERAWPRPIPGDGGKSTSDGIGAKDYAGVPLDLPAHGKVLTFGDSWTFGFNVAPRSRGFAYLTADALPLQGDVQGDPGTGYVNPGRPGPLDTGTYLQRLARLPASSPAMIIVQGSYSDTAYSPARIGAAQGSTPAALRQRFPAALIVVLGTGSPDPSGNTDARPRGVSINELDRITGALPNGHISTM